MTNRNDKHNDDVSTLDARPLADSELDAVCGGSSFSFGVGRAIGAAGTGGLPPEETQYVWVGCAWVPQGG